MSYWMTAVRPWARSDRNRPGMASNVSRTVGIASSPAIMVTGSAAAELGRALRPERPEPLGGVLGPERLQKRLDLALARLVDPPFEPPIDARQDEAGGDRGASGDGPGQRLGVGHRLPVARQPVDQPQGERLAGRDLRAEEEHLDSLRPSDQAGQPEGSPEARQDPEVRLGLTDAGRLLHHPEVAGHGDLAAAPGPVPLQGGGH